jgi:hypothetical protein
VILSRSDDHRLSIARKNSIRPRSLPDKLLQGADADLIRCCLLLSSRDFQCRNVPSVQRVRFHHARSSFGCSGELEVRVPSTGRAAIIGGARDSSRRNVPSFQRARFHRTRSSFGRSCGLEVMEVRGPSVGRSAIVPPPPRPAMPSGHANGASGVHLCEGPLVFGDELIDHIADFEFRRQHFPGVRFHFEVLARIRMRLQPIERP